MTGARHRRAPAWLSLVVSVIVVVAVIVIVAAVVIVVIKLGYPAAVEAGRLAVGADLEHAAIIGRAAPARGAVDRADTVPARLFREFAQRHGAVDGRRVVADEMRGEDGVGLNAVIDPVVERRQGVEEIGPGAARAMMHARHHE